jgi:hypothetical protein
MANQSIKAFDLMGNPLDLKSKDGKLVLTIGPAPIYLEGTSPNVLAAMLDQALTVEKGRETCLVKGVYQGNVKGEVNLKLSFYNNSMNNIKGLFRLTRVPEGFKFTRDAVAIEAAANTRTEFCLPISDMPPVTRRGRLEWEFQTVKGIEAQGRFELSHMLVPRLGKIKLDGDLREYKDLHKAKIDTRCQVVAGVADWRGPTDVSAIFQVARDDENLYVAVTVTDDKFIPPKAPFWNVDSVELFLDTDLLGDRETASYNADDHQLFVSAATREAETFAGPKDLKGVSRRQGKRRFLEIALPLKTIGIPIGIGTVIGFDLAVDDADVVSGKESHRDNQCVWAGTGENYSSPENFGMLIFK